MIKEWAGFTSQIALTLFQISIPLFNIFKLKATHGETCVVNNNESKESRYVDFQINIASLYSYWSFKIAWLYKYNHSDNLMRSNVLESVLFRHRIGFKK